MKSNIVFYIETVKKIIYGKKLIAQIVKNNDLNLNLDFIFVLCSKKYDNCKKMLSLIEILFKQFEEDKTLIEKNGGVVKRENEKIVIVTSVTDIVNEGKGVLNRITKVELISDYDMECMQYKQRLVSSAVRVKFCEDDIFYDDDFSGIASKPMYTRDLAISLLTLGIRERVYQKYRKML